VLPINLYFPMHPGGGLCSVEGKHEVHIPPINGLRTRLYRDMASQLFRGGMTSAGTGVEKLFEGYVYI
jgi:hypothetical protein